MPDHRKGLNVSNNGHFGCQRTCLHPLFHVLLIMSAEISDDMIR